MTIHDSSFDRRAFLKASGILAVGFSMSGLPAGAQTLLAPRGVAKDAVDSWLTITPRFFSSEAASYTRQGMCASCRLRAAVRPPGPAPAMRISSREAATVIVGTR